MRMNRRAWFVVALVALGAAVIVGVLLMRGDDSASSNRPAASPESPSPPASFEPSTWLYELNVPERAANVFGPSGVRRVVTVGSTASENATSFWVGCEADPAITVFDIGGEFDRLVSTLALDEGTPAQLAVEVELVGDGDRLELVRLTPEDDAPVSLDIAGIDTLELRATVVAGECGTSEVGYGVALDAGLA